MTTRKLTILALILLAAFPASASTFLTFSQTNNSLLFSIFNNGTNTVTLTASNIAIDYNIMVPNALGQASRQGLLTFQATSTGTAFDLSTIPGAGLTGLVQGGFSTITTGTIFDVLSQTVALSFTFGPNGQMSTAGNTVGSLKDSWGLTSEVQLSSAYLNFLNTTSEGLSFSLNSVNPAWSIAADGRLASANATIGGDFSSTPAPTGVPEPATMAMLGSALLGVGLFGRKRFTR